MIYAQWLLATGAFLTIMAITFPSIGSLLENEDTVVEIEEH